MLMKRVLDVAEMKQIHGGAAVSNLCASGEKLYTCATIYVGSDVTSKGVVCAYSASGAELLITIQRESEGTEALASCH